jgi:hypothetical protein
MIPKKAWTYQRLINAGINNHGINFKKNVNWVKIKYPLPRKPIVKINK